MHDATIPNLESAVSGTVCGAAMLRGNRDEIIALMERMPAEAPSDSWAQMRIFASGMLVEIGELDQARHLLSDTDINLQEHTYVAPLLAGILCHVSSALGDASLAVSAYRFLLPYRGHMCSAGYAMVIGPVDLYLAYGAHALGHRAEALEHLESAENFIQDHGMSGLARRCSALRHAMFSERSAGRNHNRNAQHAQT